MDEDEEARYVEATAVRIVKSYEAGDTLTAHALWHGIWAVNPERMGLALLIWYALIEEYAAGKAVEFRTGEAHLDEEGAWTVESKSPSEMTPGPRFVWRFVKACRERDPQRAHELWSGFLRECDVDDVELASAILVDAVATVRAGVVGDRIQIVWVEE